MGFPQGLKWIGVVERRIYDDDDETSTKIIDKAAREQAENTLS